MTQLNFFLAHFIAPSTQEAVLGDLTERNLLATSRATREILSLLAQQELHSLARLRTWLWLLPLLWTARFVTTTASAFGEILPSFHLTLAEAAEGLLALPIAFSLGIVLHRLTPVPGQLVLSAATFFGAIALVLPDLRHLPSSQPLHTASAVAAVILLALLPITLGMRYARSISHRALHNLTLITCLEIACLAILSPHDWWIAPFGSLTAWPLFALLEQRSPTPLH